VVQAASEETTTSASVLTPLPSCSTAEMLVFEFSGAGTDGKLEGALFRPVGDGPWPALVLNHGATNQPLAKALDVAPELVRRGYVLIAPRYSFAGPKPEAPEARRERDPDGDRRLCQEAAEFAQGMTFVKPERLGAAGISAGGFVVVGMLRKAQPYAAVAVVSAGVPTVPAEALSADQFQVPVLILTGDQDTVVAPTYGTNLEALLKREHRTVRMVHYPDGPHDLFKWDGKKIGSELADWFDQYLR
jgi:dienelactone hydrolase